MTETMVNVTDVEQEVTEAEDQVTDTGAEINEEGQGEQKLFAGKYKTAEELEQGYKELSKLAREKKPEAPDEYALDAIKDFVGEEGDETLDSWLGEFKELGLTQEQADKLLTRYYSDMASQMPDLDAERAKLGADGDKMVQEIRGFFGKNKSNFTDTELGAIEAALGTADAVRAIHKVITANQSKSIPNKAATLPAASADELLQEALAIKAKEGFSNSPTLMAQYDAKLREYAAAKEGAK